jgi:hypothetical protein
LALRQIFEISGNFAHLSAGPRNYLRSILRTLIEKRPLFKHDNGNQLFSFDRPCSFYVGSGRERRRFRSVFQRVYSRRKSNHAKIKALYIVLAHQRLSFSSAQSPPRLAMELDHQDALFGNNPFGNTIEKDLYYTSRLLCEADEWPGAPSSVAYQGYILMVDRGGCSFVEKVRNAQKANATAVIIADDKCLCRAGLSCISDEPCEHYEPIMDDDGTGSDINIPSMILAKPDADLLKSELIGGTMIHLRLSWPVPMTHNGQTHYTLWTSPDDTMSYGFLKTFKEAAVDIGGKGVFKPNMFISDGIAMGCRGTEISGDCPGRCTNFGRYCAPDSFDPNTTYEDQMGTKLVVESLRRACIWHVYGSVDGIGLHWWDYMEKWLGRCSTSRYSTTCAESLFVESDIDVQLVRSCMTDSGGFLGDNSNYILEGFLSSSVEDGVLFAPTMYVNGADLRGELSFANVLDAICWTFDGKSEPDICGHWRECASICPEGKSCVLKDDECVEHAPSASPLDGGVYDDDILQANTSITSEDTIPPVSTPEPTKMTTRLPTRFPTRLPTMQPSRAPVIPPTIAPVLPPTLTPVPPVPPVPPSTYPLPQTQPKEYGDGRIEETIQIFESPSNNSGGSGAAPFLVGIGAGIGVMVVFAAGFLISLKMIPRRGDRESLTGASVGPGADGSAVHDGRYS